VTDALKGALPGAAEGLPDGADAPTKETIDATKVRRVGPSGGGMGGAAGRRLAVEGPRKRAPAARGPGPRPQQTVPSHPTDPPPQVQKQLGIKLHDPTSTVVDAAKSLLAHGVAKPAWYKGGAGAAA
jgi:hypothetical protein